MKPRPWLGSNQDLPVKHRPNPLEKGYRTLSLSPGGRLLGPLLHVYMVNKAFPSLPVDGQFRTIIVVEVFEDATTGLLGMGGNTFCQFSWGCQRFC